MSTTLQEHQTTINNQTIQLVSQTQIELKHRFYSKFVSEMANTIHKFKLCYTDIYEIVFFIIIISRDLADYCK